MNGKSYSAFFHNLFSVKRTTPGEASPGVVFARVVRWGGNAALLGGRGENRTHVRKVMSLPGASTLPA